MNQQLCLPVLPGSLPRRQTRQARVVWGDNVVTIGGDDRDSIVQIRPFRISGHALASVLPSPTRRS